MTQTLIRADGTSLPYDKFTPDAGANGAGIVFFHGFKSDRNATKAQFLAETCRSLDIPFLSFDFFAHGQSGGAWADFTIGRAVYDALQVIDQLTDGPLVLVGSSMGGWVALRVMEERPDRVAALVGVAAAPDFTLDVERDMPAADRAAYGFTDTLLAEAHNQSVLDEDWTFTGPVHLLQGQMDDEVPWQTAEKIKTKFANPAAVRLTYVPDGDHRLNRPEDLAKLKDAVLDVRSRISC